jgi:serine protease Do
MICRVMTFRLLHLVVGLGCAGSSVFPLQEISAQPPALSTPLYTNGPRIRRAFTGVVAEANAGTVRISEGARLVAYGLVVRPDGYVVTKASQLQDEPQVRLDDGRELPAEYVAYSPDHDVALLKVAADNLPVVQWQEGEDPRVGAWVITPDQQGAPGSVGVVSVARRSIARVKEPAILGIQMRIEASPVVVDAVAEGSAAEQAGLRPEDIIHQVDDIEIATTGQMKYEISRRSPGDQVRLLVERDGERLEVRAILTHPFGEFQSRIAMQNMMGGELSQRRNGFPTVLQHDSVLEPEQCGGPLVDLDGKVVGINIARAGRTETYAIPDDVLRPLVDDLLSGQYPPPGEQRPTLATDVAGEDVTAPSDTAGE